ITSIVLLPHISNLTFCTLLYPSGFEYYTDIEIHKGNRTEINENISTTGRYFDKTGTLIPVGAILPYAGQVAPRGWLLCDGTMLFKSDSKFYLFEDLIQLIGTTYGGDGQNTWQLPDLRSLFPIGAGQGQGFSDYQVSKTGGQERVALDPKEMPPHTHSIIHTHMSQDDGHYHKIITNNGTGNDGGIDDATKVSSSGTSDSKTEVEYAKVTIFPNDGKYHKTIGNDRSYYENISRSGNAGGEESKPEQYNEHGQKTDAGEFQVQSHENMPPYIALNYIIKL
ncbi:MAG: phage tail protein, partial [Flammeovirgaceae bacterium]